jgi:hypothetical protein
MALVSTTETIANAVNGANISGTWTGDKVQGVSYFLRPTYVTTVNYSNTGAVTGNVVIQGSLVPLPSAEKDWVDLITIDFSNAAPQSITGNWIWMRGKATSFTSGIINISIVY